MRLKKIVTIGGGTGSFTVLSGLRGYENLDIKAIVSMSDDGGSTGKLRDEYGVLPPGDIRQCLVALSEASLELRKLFGYRFSGGSLHGQSVGNIVISGAEKAEGDFVKGLALVHKILAVKGEVIPVTLQPANLMIELGNGRIIKGQRMIEDFFMLTRFGVSRVFFEESLPANPRALTVIAQADLILIGPGSLYDSLIPNFIPTGMTTALKKSKAKKLFICNLMNKFGDTDDFTVVDHMREVERYIAKDFFTHVLYNTKPPAPELVKKYREEGSPVVLGSRGSDRGVGKSKAKLVGADILADKLHEPRKEYKNADLIRRTLIRHDPDKLAKEILKLV